MNFFKFFIFHLKLRWKITMKNKTSRQIFLIVLFPPTFMLEIIVLFSTWIYDGKQQ